VPAIRYVLVHIRRPVATLASGAACFFPSFECAWVELTHIRRCRATPHVHHACGIVLRSVGNYFHFYFHLFFLLCFCFTLLLFFFFFFLSFFSPLAALA